MESFIIKIIKWVKYELTTVQRKVIFEEKSTFLLLHYKTHKKKISYLYDTTVQVG